MFRYIPDQLPPSAPLVVVLHGCTQNARQFATASGWVQLADKWGIALALPEQKPANNGLNCFTWFQASDATRDQGEALSIKQMVDKMSADYKVDEKRVYVTGLSAGGGMTAVMLATYPEVFAGGGIVAGLPYGCTIQCMGTGRPFGGPVVGLPSGPVPNFSDGSTVDVPLSPGICLYFPQFCPSFESFEDHTLTPSAWGELVRKASHYTGPYPKVSIWHGTADTLVNPINASELVEQWVNVHGIDPTSGVSDTVKGFPHQTFRDASGKLVVESYSITGMGHGEPVDPGTGEDRCGTAGPFVIDVDICASFFIANFWGLIN
jgi:poly(3-hydroxybutyrate) depolymerase